MIEARDKLQAISLLRPVPRLFARGLLGFALGTTPIFAVFYWLAAGRTIWFAVLAVHVGVVMIAALSAVALSRTQLVLTPSGVRERGFFGRVTSVDRNAVAELRVIEIYVNDTMDHRPHLFAIDARGRVLLRMRGQFWSRNDVTRVAAHLGYPDLEPDVPVTMAELFDSSPRLLYWFERPPGRR